MSWLLPSALVIAGFAALGTLALHFIAHSRPLAEPLPTARFIPLERLQARTRAIALSDALLLVLRLAAIAAIAAAVAGPVLPSRGRIARIVVADRSRSVSSIASVRDSARAYMRAGDQLVVFDSAAIRQGATFDSLSATSARGSLSAALAAGVRGAVRVASTADSIELVVVSPWSREELDNATLKIRNIWPGRIRVVRVAEAAATLVTSVETGGVTNANDAVVAGVSLMRPTGSRPGTETVRLIRSAPTAADSTWARARGHALVNWPAAGSRPSWAAREPLDTIDGVASASGTLVAPFARQWSLAGHAVARWADGEPAAVEHATGDGCIRDVGIAIDEASDVTLRTTFREFASALLAPCGGDRALAPLDSVATLAIARGSGLNRLAPAAALRDSMSQTSRATPWLLLLGALLLLGELAARRVRARLP